MSQRYGSDECARAIRFGRVQRRDAILDVGGGGGTNLRPLRAAGFRRLLGIDAFVTMESFCRGFELRCARIQDVPGQFRLIMMHHSFEHMPDPHEVLNAAAARLADDGVLLVRIPVLGYGWQKYGVNWVELDAPRHLYLHTRPSFEGLVRRHGFEVVDVRFDSTELEIWGSEQYVRGIPLMSAGSYGVNPGASGFSPAEIAAFREKISGLNEKGKSGRAAFVLRKGGGQPPG
jgi:SAM-dependent methyltransferase